MTENTLHPSTAQAFDEIDAALFSGDTFLSEANASVLENFIQRWSRGLEEMKGIRDAAEEEEKPRPTRRGVRSKR